MLARTGKSKLTRGYCRYKATIVKISTDECFSHCVVVPHTRTAWIWCSMCIVRPMEAMLRSRHDLFSQKEGVVMGFPVVDDDLSDLPPLTPPKLARYQATLVDRQSLQGPPTPASPPTPVPLSRPITSPRLGVRRRSASRRQFLAAARGDVDDLRSWLCNGGDPNLTDSDGWAPLLHASVSALEALDMGSFWTESYLVGKD